MAARRCAGESPRLAGLGRPLQGHCAIRRDARVDELDDAAAKNIAAPDSPETEDIADDRLRLIFTCCHPALQPDAQVALTLREVCGLTTEEIAHAFLTAPPTLAQRIVRAKNKIRDAKIPTRCPHRKTCPTGSTVCCG